MVQVASVVRSVFYNKEEQIREILPGYEEYELKQIARMTHVEVFSYPVWEPGGDMNRLEEDAVALFDYKKRNPLTKEAGAVILDRW